MVIVEPSNELKLALRQDALVNVRAMETKSISNSAGRKPTLTGMLYCKCCCKASFPLEMAERKV